MARLTPRVEPRAEDVDELPSPASAAWKDRARPAVCGLLDGSGIDPVAQ